MISREQSLIYMHKKFSASILALDTGLKKAAETAGLAKEGEAPKQLAEVIGTLIGSILAFVGVIFLIIMIYGGFKWMTSGGSDEAKKARTLIVNAVIGLVIIAAAYLITNFVVDRVLSTAGVTP